MEELRQAEEEKKLEQQRREERKLEQERQDRIREEEMRKLQKQEKEQQEKIDRTLAQDMELANKLQSEEEANGVFHFPSLSVLFSPLILYLPLIVKSQLYGPVECAARNFQEMNSDNATRRSTGYTKGAGIR